MNLPVKNVTTDFFIDNAVASLIKHGEELCGDKVVVVHRDDSLIMILSDGLGSGVKANILATLTTKIAGTMLEKGADIDQVVETIGRTLPTCKERNLAYSTFTIIQAFKNGHVYLAEFDNPAVFYLRGGYITPIIRTTREIAGKTIKEGHLTVKDHDYLVAISDGVVHAGIGGVLNLGWQWSNVAKYLEKAARKKPSAKHLTNQLVTTCQELYLDHPGDDATVSVIGIRQPRAATLAIGPPSRRDDDSKVAQILAASPGKKVVCGGTTSSLVAREWQEELTVDLTSLHPKAPPMGQIKGIDLVTEGIITITGALEKLHNLQNDKELEGEDGISCLARTLWESDIIHFLVGRAINPAHQNPGLPYNLALKQQVIRDLAELLSKEGKQVITTFF